MASKKQATTLVGLPDRFVAVEIETQVPPAFDAAQYSFFGDLSAADSGLEGALEDGFEAPPSEEGLSQDDGLHTTVEEENLNLDEEGDLSVASIFRNQLGLGPAKTPPTKRVDPDDDAGLDALLTDPLSVARKQFRDDDYDQRGLPLELYPDMATLGAVGQPTSLFGAPASPYGLFDGYGSNVLGSQHATTDGSMNAGRAAMPLPPQQQPSPPPTAPPEPSPAASSTGSALLQMLKMSSQQPVKAMTLEDLEARILANTEARAAGPEALQAHISGPEAGGPDTLASAVPSEQQQRSGAYLTRPLPGMPVGSGGGARGGPAAGPRMPVPMAGGPPPPQLQQQLLPGPPPGIHGLASPQQPQGVQYPQPQPHHPHNHLHGGPHGPMPPIHMMLPGPTNLGMYPQPPMMGAGPDAHNLMYNSNGMMPPPPQPHHHHHPPGSGMMPQGPMGPPGPYGPGGMYPLRGPMPPYGSGAMGMGGAPPYMHDGYPMRPMGPPPGMLGTMHGMPPRPGPFGYGPPGLGPGSGPQQQLPPPPQGAQRPPAVAGPPPPALGGAQRSGPVLGPGAAGGTRPSTQGWQASGPQAAPEFGQQFARAATSGPVALAAAAAAAGRAGGAPSGPGGRLGGKWMRPEDLEYVVRSMLYTVANGVPYVEDYYYQAFVHKHVSQPSRQQLSPGAFPMAAPFVPEALRELLEDQMTMMRLDPSARAKFVEGLQGLGKIVLSNVRTPKVLMDLSDRGAQSGDARARATSEGDGASDVGKGTDQQGRGARPLEQEPLLAARIMIEDCMNLLLDVDDIDRLANHMAALAQAQQRAAAVAAALPHPAAGPTAAAVAAAAGAAPVGRYSPSSAAPPTMIQLRQRRELLLAGINGAFRLPSTPREALVGGLTAEGSMDLDGRAAATAPVGVSLGDGVLVRILALSKGRGVVARALLAIATPASLVTAAAVATHAPRQAQVGKAASAAAAISAESNGNGSNGAIVEAKVGSDAPAAPVSSRPEDAAAAGADEATAGSLQGADVPSPFALLWGTLRSAWVVFGTSLQQDIDASTERPFLEATSRLAAALREALLRLPTQRDVVDAMAAFNAGCRQHVEALCLGNPAGGASMEATLLPLAQTRAVEAAAEPSVVAAPTAWLGEALAALVRRASQLGLATAEGEAATSGEGGKTDGPNAPLRAGEGDGTAGSRGGGTGAVAAEWRQEYDALQERLSRHLAALGGIHSMAAASDNAQALAVVRALSCRLLVNAMLQHASAEQAQQLKAALSALAS